MTNFSYVINDELGIHARPAGLLAKLCMKFACDITLAAPNKTVNPKRIMALMGAGVKEGDTVTVSCTGEDEKTACAEIKAFFEQHL